MERMKKCFAWHGQDARMTQLDDDVCTTLNTQWQSNNDVFVVNGGVIK